MGYYTIKWYYFSLFTVDYYFWYFIRLKSVRSRVQRVCPRMESFRAKNAEYKNASTIVYTYNTTIIYIYVYYKVWGGLQFAEINWIAVYHCAAAYAPHSVLITHGENTRGTRFRGGGGGYDDNVRIWSRRRVVSSVSLSLTQYHLKSRRR